MTERMGDERLDHVIRAFLEWQAEEVAGAPSAAEVATRIGNRGGTATAGLRVAPHVAWVLLAGLLVIALLGALATGAIQRPPAPPLAVSNDFSPIPSASLPSLGLPGARVGPAGEYGWEGGPLAPGGVPAGMHRVVADGADYREATAMFFAVGADCLTASRAQQSPVRVAGFDGVSVEPFERPVQFNHDGNEITRAYALAVGDRTLCVYLTWHPATTGDELDAAVRILDTLRAEPIGKDRVRIVFTLKDGWDTG